MSARKNGRVYLVGAGPGDPELLTLKAARVIGEADVLLVDDLVSDDILSFAHASVRVVHVGKRGGCQSTPQEFIERLMVHEAKEGNVVVRLKGGDPYVFGRGGEERATLLAAGIQCDVINGITSGLAAPGAIGVPLTHRDYCHGAIFVTGHTGSDVTTAPNWRALVATGLPLVIYMGISNLSSIVQSLIDAGMRADMPAAAIQNATRDDQLDVVTILRDLVTRVHHAGIQSPAILVIGETVALAADRALDNMDNASGDLRLRALNG
jgi:uroporphyrin-III C-methyltransferase